MNLAVDLPDDIIKLLRNLPDQQNFLVEAIQREWQRRKALAQLLKLSERISTRNQSMTDQQLEDLMCV